MSTSLVACCPVCQSQVPPIAIPGPPGTNGADGAAGAAGENGYTLTTANFTSQGDLTTAFTISVVSSLAFAVGMDVFAGQGSGAALANPGPWAGVITAIPTPNQITVKNLRTVDQSVTVSAGAVFSAMGQLPATPIAVAQGGTGGTTKSTGRLGLGVGQDPLISSGAALAQVILAAGFAQVGAIDIQITAGGVWEIRGQVGIDMLGVTFAANRTITCRVQNITQATTVATGVLHTQSPTTTGYPTHFLVLPPVKYTGAAANDHLQLQIQIDVVNSAGTLTVDSGSLEAIPISLT